MEKDIKNNIVFVSRNYFSFDKRRRVFHVGSLKWLTGLPPDQFTGLQCKVKFHLHLPYFSLVSVLQDWPGRNGLTEKAIGLTFYSNLS